MIFELYFPFAIKDKNKSQIEYPINEISDDDKEFVELSIFLQKELQINVKSHSVTNLKKTIYKEEKDPQNLKHFEKYFYFLLKFLLKKDIKNSKSAAFKIEESIYNELKKTISTVEKENSANPKSQVIIIRKNFEFEILDFYYDRQNILQYSFY